MIVSEYIKKEDAEQSIVGYFVPQTYDGNDIDRAFKIAEAILNNIPSAEVVTVRHGKWIDDEGQRVLMENEIAKGENWKVCSVCGAGMCIGAKYETDRCYHPCFQSYCPNCGAKMDNAYEDVKEQEHETD